MPQITQPPFPQVTAASAAAVTETLTDISASPVNPARKIQRPSTPGHPDCSEATTSASTVHHGFAAGGQF